MLSVKDIIEINKEFSNGRIVNQSSLGFAVETTTENWLKSAAVLTRSVLIDHVFEDGNKRTAAAIIMVLMDLNKVEYDPGRIPMVVVNMLMKNLTSLKQIEKVIKDAIR